MEFVHEVSARLENKPGRLSKICSGLAQEKINIRALSVMTSGERSVLHLVVDQLEPTMDVLRGLVVEGLHQEVLAVELENRPGALTRLLERLAAEHINIEYAYASGASAPGKSLGIFHTSNPKRAMEILRDLPTNGPGHSPHRRPLHAR